MGSWFGKMGERRRGAVTADGYSICAGHMRRKKGKAAPSSLFAADKRVDSIGDELLLPHPARCLSKA